MPAEYSSKVFWCKSTGFAVFIKKESFKLESKEVSVVMAIAEEDSVLAEEGGSNGDQEDSTRFVVPVRTGEVREGAKLGLSNCVSARATAALVLGRSSGESERRPEGPRPSAAFLEPPKRPKKLREPQKPFLLDEVGMWPSLPADPGVTIIRDADAGVRCDGV